MKSKFRLFFLIPLISFSLSGCLNENQSTSFDPLISIYREAINNGFNGTYEEWLETIKGQKGDTGEKGDQGDKGETGDQGPKGDKGDTGERGEDGLSSLTGNGTPNNELGKNGDQYTDLDTFNYYIKIKGEWVFQACLKAKSAYETYIEKYPHYSGNEEMWIKELSLGTLTKKVSFETYGGNLINDEVFCSGELVNVDYEASKYGYTFLGWYFDANFEEPFSNFYISENTTLYAKYEILDEVIEVQFNLDSHVRVLVYNTQNYDDNPEETSIAYARNGDTGVLDWSGEGQINFKVVVDSGYALGSIVVDGNYKNLKNPNDIGFENIYRITKIKSDLLVSITTSELEGSEMISSFSYHITDEGDALFYFNVVEGVDHVDVYNGVNYLETIECESNEEFEFNYHLLDGNHLDFMFVPWHTSNVQGKAKEASFCYSSTARNASFPKIEITTENYALPSGDIVVGTDGLWGATLINNSYVSSSIKLYDGDNNLLYQSIDDLKDSSNEFSGSKIKLRGNTSATIDKKPYKIKLNSKLDLLNGLYERSDNSYLSKEWVLLAQGNSWNYIFGREVSNLVDPNYELGYSYVSLFLNGDYRGLYVLSDAVNEDSCHIDSDGFVVENDPYWWGEDLSFETPITDNFTPLAYSFKYPDSDDINAESPEYLYIKEYLTTFENLLLNNDEHYLDYIDINSFARWVLIHDILATYDSGGSNMYVVKKDAGESKLIAGPAWDFDTIFYGGGNDFPETYSRFHEELSPFYFVSYLLDKNDFQIEYQSIFNDLCDSVLLACNNGYEKINYESWEQLVLIENSIYSYESCEDFSISLLKLSDHIDWLKNQIENS